MAELIELIDDIFEEEALVIGGMIAVHGMDDDLVWRLVENLGAIRRRAMLRLHKAGTGPSPEQNPLSRHPAIDDFLRSLRRSPSAHRGHDGTGSGERVVSEHPSC